MLNRAVEIICLNGRKFILCRKISRPVVSADKAQAFIGKVKGVDTRQPAAFLGKQPFKAARRNIEAFNSVCGRTHIKDAPVVKGAAAISLPFLLDSAAPYDLSTSDKKKLTLICNSRNIAASIGAYPFSIHCLGNHIIDLQPSRQCHHNQAVSRTHIVIALGALRNAPNGV